MTRAYRGGRRKLFFFVARSDGSSDTRSDSVDLVQALWFKLTEDVVADAMRRSTIGGGRCGSSSSSEERQPFTTMRRKRHHGINGVYTSIVATTRGCQW